MKYDVKNLTTELQAALREFSLFSFDDKGYSLRAVECEANRTQTDGKTLTVFYTNKARFHGHQRY